MSSSSAMLLYLVNGVPDSFRDRQRSEVVLKNKQKRAFSAANQSTAVRSKPFCTSTRAAHTRQKTFYQQGAVRVGVVRARGRSFPAATVPIAAVFVCAA